MGRGRQMLGVPPSSVYLSLFQTPASQGDFLGPPHLTPHLLPHTILPIAWHGDSGTSYSEQAAFRQPFLPTTNRLCPQGPDFPWILELSKQGTLSPVCPLVQCARG